MTGILTKRGSLETDTQKEPTCNEGKDQGKVSINPGTQRRPSNHQKLGEGMEQICLTAFRRSSPANTLILDPYPPEMKDNCETVI